MKPARAPERCPICRKKTIRSWKEFDVAFKSAPKELLARWEFRTVLYCPADSFKGHRCSGPVRMPAPLTPIGKKKGARVR